MKNIPAQLKFQGSVYTIVTAAEDDREEMKELQALLTNAKKAFGKLVGKDGKAYALGQEALREHEDISKAKAYWTSKARDVPAIKNFLTKYNLSNDKEKFLLGKLQDATVAGKNLPTVWGSIRRYLEAAYKEYRRKEAREPAYAAGLPEEIVKKLLPPEYAFEVAPDGSITKEFELFGNAVRTIEVKRKAMSILLTKWNLLLDTLERDLTSSDPKTRLKALATSIIVNTGIRPGKGGTSKLKDDEGVILRDEEGKPLRGPTFGATGLLSEHVEFVRDNFAVMTFVGKSGSQNVAELTDPILVRNLKQQLELADAGSDSGPVFTTQDGQSVSAKNINAYLTDILGPGVSAKDFRSLKATNTFYSSLKNRQHELAYALKQLKTKAGEDIRNKVVQIIVDHLLEAATHAQQQISHDSLATTIQYYIQPRVIISYLTNAGMDKALEVVVGDGKALKIRFDPMDFYESVIKSSKKAASMQRVAKSMFYFGDDFVDYDIDETIESLDDKPPA